MNLVPELPPDPQNKIFWEDGLWREGIRWVAGLDEAGRGAWAGPVVAAAVVFPPQTFIPEIDDSKKINPQKREELFDVICREAQTYGVGVVEPGVIDSINILEATREAMRKALGALTVKPDYLLIDGNQGIAYPLPQKTLIKGDHRSMTVGAASILAKVTRDRIMRELEKEFAHFRFSVHKGYGTKLHQGELEKYGALSCHRMSFKPIKQYFISS